MVTAVRMARYNVMASLLSVVTGIALAQENASMLYLRLVPQSVDVLVGSLVTLECQVASGTHSGSLRWKFNNKSWGLFDHPPASMTTNRSTNLTIYSRRLTAQRKHNESLIQCVTTLSVGQTIHSNQGVLMVRDFQEIPRSVNSTVGDTVDFYCRPYFTGYYISWLINGTELCQFNNSSGISELSETSLRIHSVQQQFNNTFVHCKISTTSIISPPAILLIQGELGAVGDLHVAAYSPDSLTISWTAPFSLDITDSHPDLWYTLSILTPAGGPLHCPDCQTTTTDTFYNLSLSGLSQGLYEVSVVSINAYRSAQTSSKLMVYLVEHEESGCNTSYGSNATNDTPFLIPASREAATTANTITLSGVGVGVTVGVMATAILVILGAICWYHSTSSRFCKRREIRRGIMQRNPAYEGWGPKQSPTDRQSAVLPKVGQRGRELSGFTTYTAPTPQQETVYEEIA